MKVYYNEFDKNAARWLHNLSEAGEIEKGFIDERSIKEVRGADLAEVNRAHFFAGIGGWDYALRLAGWPEDEEVWTGSCPCQPFSNAGKKGGTSDPRHLWPEFFRLISERRPGVVFGEQVGSKAGLGWLDGVFSDLEGEGYSCGAVIVGAHSVGAPHIRQRLYWVADCDDKRRRAGHGEAQTAGGEVGLWASSISGNGGALVGLADDGGARFGEIRGASDEFIDASAKRAEASDLNKRYGKANPWSDFRIVPCTDGKARRTGSRVFPLAHGLPRSMGNSSSWRKGLARSASRARIGMLKGSGNAIVPEIAAQFIRSYMEVKS